MPLVGTIEEPLTGSQLGTNSALEGEAMNPGEAQARFLSVPPEYEQAQYHDSNGRLNEQGREALRRDMKRLARKYGVPIRYFQSVAQNLVK